MNTQFFLSSLKLYLMFINFYNRDMTTYFHLTLVASYFAGRDTSKLQHWSEKCYSTFGFAGQLFKKEHGWRERL